MPKQYGWLPDIPDERDLPYSAIKPRVRLHPKVDLRQSCSQVEQQGKLGSCTANALAGNIEYLDNFFDPGYTDVSRLFIYYNERELEGTVDYDAGASLRDGIKTLKKTGYCWEKTWPYKIALFDRKPPLRCYKEARQHCIQSYYRIHNLQEMLICLSQGYPFVFGFTVYESFESAAVARTGVANMPKKGERVLGGHAVMAVGYNQKEKRFLIRNSWGRGWGQGRLFYYAF